MAKPNRPTCQQRRTRAAASSGPGPRSLRFGCAQASTTKTPRNRGDFSGWAGVRAGSLCSIRLNGGESGIRTHGTSRYTGQGHSLRVALGGLPGGMPPGTARAPGAAPCIVAVPGTGSGSRCPATGRGVYRERYLGARPSLVDASPLGQAVESPLLVCYRRVHRDLLTTESEGTRRPGE